MSFFTPAAKMFNELHRAELDGRIDRVLRKYTHAELHVTVTWPVSPWTRPRAKLAFEAISKRYDYRRSTAITTNRPFKEWPEVFPEPLHVPYPENPGRRRRTTATTPTKVVTWSPVTVGPLSSTVTDDYDRKQLKRLASYITRRPLRSSFFVVRR